MSKTSLTVVAACLFVLTLSGASTAPEAKRRPLDLPSGGTRGDESDEEDALEAIVFFGETYEGDGFFFLLDRSGSMNGFKLDMLKSEMVSALEELSPTNEFGIVSFSGSSSSFSEVPVRATEAQVGQARGWVLSLQAAGSTMMLSAAQELLAIAEQSTRFDRRIIAVGDGSPNNPGPEGTLEGILAANTSAIPIDTLLIGANESAADFMQQLASASGGTFRLVSF